MSPVAHFLISWLSTVEIINERRERAIVTIAGVSPDLDGIGIIPDKVLGTTDLYIKYHHYLGHSVFSAFFIASIATIFSKTQKVTVWFLSFTLVHMHIICDIIGSKGPDGYNWPIFYLYPIYPRFELTWKYQWELISWQNQTILVVLMIICIIYAIRKEITFLEVFSKRLDEEAFNMYKRYFKNK